MAAERRTITKTGFDGAERQHPDRAIKTLLARVSGFQSQFGVGSRSAVLANSALISSLCSSATNG